MDFLAAQTTLDWLVPVADTYWLEPHTLCAWQHDASSKLVAEKVLPEHAMHVPLAPILVALPASKPATAAAPVAAQHVTLEPHAASIVLVPSLVTYSVAASQVFQGLQQLASSFPEEVNLPVEHAAHVPALPVAVVEPAV